LLLFVAVRTFILSALIDAANTQGTADERAAEIASQPAECELVAVFGRSFRGIAVKKRMTRTD